MFNKTLHYHSARYLELMCFKLSQLSNCVCFTMESQYKKTIMIHLVDKSDFLLSDHEKRCKSLQPVELAKSEDCDFSCIKLALQKVSVSRKYKSNQEISTILCELVCYPSLNKLYYFHPRIDGFLDICHF